MKKNGQTTLQETLSHLNHIFLDKAQKRFTISMYC